MFSTCVFLDHMKDILKVDRIMPTDANTLFVEKMLASNDPGWFNSFISALREAGKCIVLFWHMHTRTRTHKYKWINGRVLEIEYMRVFLSLMTWLECVRPIVGLLTVQGWVIFSDFEPFLGVRQGESKRCQAGTWVHSTVIFTKFS